VPESGRSFPPDEAGTRDFSSAHRPGLWEDSGRTPPPQFAQIPRFPAADRTFSVFDP